MITIRPAVTTDTDFLKELALIRSNNRLEETLASGNIQIITADHTSIGFLSYSILWGTLPFLELIEIQESQRGQKFGESSVRAWERDMGNRGFDLVLTSTNADSNAQHFWRKMGYVDCGALTVRNKPAEVFFQLSI